MSLDSDKPSLCITGASGFLGSRLTHMADQQGYTVHSLVRRGHNRKSLPAGRIFPGSLPYDIPVDALRGIDCLIHCATATDDPSDSEFEAVNLEGLEHLLHLAQSTGVRRIVFLSSQSVTTGADSPYARTKKRSEEMLKAHAIPATIIRPGLIVGPGAGTGLFGRMIGTVEGLPAIPLLGGGKALIQPLWVDDLCRVILRSAGEPSGESHTYQLGDPEGIPLRAFLEAIGFGLRGKKPLSVSVPLAPVEWVVKLGELLGIPLPIGSSNLKGLKQVARMDTAVDMQKFEIEYPDLVQKIAETVTDRESTYLPQKPLELVQVGSGKIAMIHSLSLSRRPGVRIAGMVDPNPGALGFLQNAGVPLDHFSDLDDALSEIDPDGVVVTSPSHTHLPVIEKCLKNEIPVLTEKPAALSAEDLEKVCQLAHRHADVPFAVGYQVPLTASSVDLKTRLTPKDLGEPKEFFAFAFQTHILDGRKRWETDPERSGGGVLINFSSHLLSMIAEFFPTAKLEATELHSVFSEDVEDAATLNFGSAGLALSSWSVPHLDQTELALWIRTDKNIIRATNVDYWVADSNEWIHETHFEGAFDPAPGLSGTGFDREHTHWLGAINRGLSDRISLDRAVKIESWIHQAYQSQPERDREAASRLYDWAQEADRQMRTQKQWRDS